MAGTLVSDCDFTAKDASRHQSWLANISGVILSMDSVNGGTCSTTPNHFQLINYNGNVGIGLTDPDSLFTDSLGADIKRGLVVGQKLSVGGATLDSAVSVTGGGHFSGGLVVGAKETIGTSLGIAGATVDSALSGTSGKLTGGLVVGKLLNFTGATGTATIGAGDSIQVSLAGITATAIVFLSYNMKTFASADTVPTYYIPAVGKFTIFGKYNKVVAWIVAHI